MTHPVIVEEREKTEEIPRSNTLSLSNLTDDKDIISDAKFLDDFQSLLEKHQTSKLSTPFMSQLRSVNEKFRRSVKRRIEYTKKHQSNFEQPRPEKSGANYVEIEDAEPLLSFETQGGPFIIGF